MRRGSRRYARSSEGFKAPGRRGSAPVHDKCAVGASQAPCRRHVGHSRVERPRSLGCGGGRCRPVHSARPCDCSGEHRQSRALARVLVTRARVRSPSSDWPLSLRVRGAELLLARPRPSVLAELAVEVAVWRRVQQTNTGRIPLDAFRVTPSGLAPVIWLPTVDAGPPILRISRPGSAGPTTSEGLRVQSLRLRPAPTGSGARGAPRLGGQQRCFAGQCLTGHAVETLEITALFHPASLKDGRHPAWSEIARIR
jgi:hypothetical protein